MPRVSGQPETATTNTSTSTSITSSLDDSSDEKQEEEAEWDIVLEEQLQKSLAERHSSNNDSPVFLAAYLGRSLLAMVSGYLLQPILLHATANLFGIKPSVDDFESSFFGLLSIVYSVFAGQTFLFLYERQINIVQELYGEIFALELLVQETFLCCNDPGIRKELAWKVSHYLQKEIYSPMDMSSPFDSESPYMQILDALTKMQERGMPIGGCMDACKKLAGAQSRRTSMAASIMPTVHWIFMHGMEFIFVMTFLVFDASEIDMTKAGAVVPEERRLFFGALFGLLALTTQVLKDLDDPISGIYAFRTALDERITYLETMLDDLETQPADYVPNSVLTLQVLGMISVEKTSSPFRGGTEVQEDDGDGCALSVPGPSVRKSRGRAKANAKQW